MKYDKKIRSMVKNIKYRCESYLENVEIFNECASTDRQLENIIESVKELENLHNKRFRTKTEIKEDR